MHFALNSLLQLVLLLLWREVAVASSQNCDLGCHSGFRERKIRTGQLHYIPCHLPPGVTRETLDFYLNDDTCPLDINGDSNLVVGGTHLEIKSVGPAYEGRYYCRFNDLDPEPVQCVYVLGYPEFPSCGGSGSCVVDKEVVEGQNFTLEYDIRYVGGGCQNYKVSLRLDAMVLNESDYNYNSSSKTRYVRKTLPYVTRSHEGFYNLTMTPMYRNDRDPNLVLSVRLIVREATEPPVTSQPPSSTLSSSTPYIATTLSTPTLSTPTLSTPNRTTVGVEPKKSVVIASVMAAVVLAGIVLVLVLLAIFQSKRLSGKSFDDKDVEVMPLPVGGPPDILPSSSVRKSSDSSTMPLPALLRL